MLGSRKDTKYMEVPGIQKLLHQDQGEEKDFWEGSSLNRRGGGGLLAVLF